MAKDNERFRIRSEAVIYGFFLLTIAGGHSTGQMPLDSTENHWKTLRAISSGKVPADSFSDSDIADRRQCEQG